MTTLKAVKTGITDDWDRPIAVGLGNETYVDVACGMFGSIEDWHTVTKDGEPNYPVKLSFNNSMSVVVTEA